MRIRAARFSVSKRHCIPGLFAAVAFCSLAPLQTMLANAKEIVLPFPNEKGYGTISKVIREGMLEANAKKMPLGEAKGTLKLPADTIVFFEAGPKFFQNPQVLQKFPPESIAYIKMQFTAMDDAEEKMCDRAIEALLHLSGLRAASFDKSDTTDKGISRLSGMPKLRAISTTETMVNGDCIRSLSTCPSLSMLRFGAIQMNNESLRYLKDLKSLKRLVVNRCGINSQGVGYIAACSTITQLDVSNNPKITDADAMRLKTLKKLEYINLRDTSVTIQGIRAFASGSNVKIVMPKLFNQYTKRERAEIDRIKGNIVFDFDHRSTDPDYSTIFGTINRK